MANNTEPQARRIPTPAPPSPPPPALKWIPAYCDLQSYDVYWDMIQRSSHTLHTDFITSAGTAFLKFPITVCVSKAPTGLRYYTNARSKNLRALTLWPKRCSKIQSKPVWQLDNLFLLFCKWKRHERHFQRLKQSISNLRLPHHG